MAYLLRASFTHAAGAIPDPPWFQLRFYGGNPATTSSMVYDGHTTPGYATSSTTTTAGIYDDSHTYSNDQYAQGTLLTWGGFGAGGYAWLILRASGADATGKYYLFRTNSFSGAGNTEFGIMWNDTYTALQNFATTFVSGDRVKVQIIGTVVEVFKNGLSIGTYDTASDTNKVTSGAPGLGASGSISGFGEWEGGNVGTLFGKDDFTGTDGTLLTAHAADLGGPWLKHPASNYTNAAPVLDGNRVRPTPTFQHSFFLTATPPSVNQDVNGIVIRPTNNDIWFTGVSARMDATGDNRYDLRVSSDNGSVDLLRRDSGTTKLFATYAAAIGNSDPCSLQLVVTTIPRSTFGADDFTGTDGTVLVSHTPTGANAASAWAAITTTGEDFVLVNGRIRANQSASYTPREDRLVGTFGDDYSVSVDFVFKTAQTDDSVGIGARQALDGSGGYRVVYESFSSFRRFNLFAGSTSLATSAYGFPATDTVVNVELVVSGSNIVVYLDGVMAMSVINTTYTTGAPTMYASINTGTPPSDTTGIHFDNFKVRTACAVQLDAYVRGKPAILSYPDNSNNRLTSVGKVGWSSLNGGVTNDGFVLDSFRAYDAGASSSGTLTKSVTVQSVLRKTLSKSVTVSATKRATVLKTVSASAVKGVSSTTVTKTVSASGVKRQTVLKTTSISGVKLKPSLIKTVGASAVLLSTAPTANTYLKFRARTVSGEHIITERAVHYGNNGVKFNESLPKDDEYILKPENTKEIWKRAMELTDRYGYTLLFDELGDCVLRSVNAPHAVFDIVATDATVGALAKKISPSAYGGNYYEALGAVTVRKTVQGARIDVCLPRGVALSDVTCKVYRASAPAVSIATIVLSPASPTPAFFYDFRTEVNGTNATVQTVYSGDFDSYIVELSVASGTSWFDSIFTYHTDPDKPLLPGLSTAKNAISINTNGGMDDARNMVTVVGRRKGAVTDSEKFADANNPENEFYISRAVDVPSITDPTALNYTGYARETVIYNTTIADDDFAEYLARSFIYRQRVPAPSAPIEHTLLPVIQLDDPVYALDTLYDTLLPTETLYVTAVTHAMKENGSSITSIETTGYPEFPSYEPREDIDIDQPEFGGFPVANVSVSYLSLTGQLRTNLPKDSSALALSKPNDIVQYSAVPITGGALQLGALNAQWPPVPGSFFIKPNLSNGTIQSVSNSMTLLTPGSSMFPISIPDGTSISSVTLTRTIRSSFNAKGSFGTDTFPITQHMQDSPWGFYYEWDQTRDTVTVKRGVVNGQTLIDPSSTVGYSATVNYFKGNYGQGDSFLTNNPYHHFFDLDYRRDTTARRNVALPWIQGDSSAAYTLPSTITSCDVIYRRLWQGDGTGTFVDPYSGVSPFYDPYTSELDNVVTTTFDALVSGRYRVSIRDTKSNQVVAWLTEPTADPDDENAHWSFVGAGAAKTLTWDGVDQVGVWNKLQSQAYADAAHGEFEQDQTPVIGKGFYVWNREVDDGQPGPLALISGDFQGEAGHPILTQVGAPVFGVSTFGSFYVKIEAQNDRLMSTSKGGVRSFTTETAPPAGVTSLYANGGTSAYIYTHLPRPSGLELTISDWVGVTDYTLATDAQKADPANWSSAPDADATIRNAKPLRVRFSVQPRPGSLWISKQDEVSVKLSRVVHPRIHIHDQYVVWDGTNFAGTSITNRRVESRRLVNDSHTIRYEDTTYRKAKDFYSATNPQGTDWVFSPSDFKKNFRGIDNEPLVFGDYLQLEEVPKWDTNRQIGGTRSRLQIAFMNYLWYLSAYTQDRSGRFVWAYNPTFVDKSKIITNTESQWPDPSNPSIASTSSTFKVPPSDDPMTLHRRTVVCRQWTDEKVDGADWKSREMTKWAFPTGSIGDHLLRHKWKDHDPRSATINGITWASLTLDQDHYSQQLRVSDADAYLDNASVVASFAELAYPTDAVNRQLGTHNTTVTRLANWSWEAAPLWIPCVTRDFFPYYLVPPMPDSAYGSNKLSRRFIYATVDERVAGANNTGDDVAAGDTWSSATAEMTQLDSVQAFQGSTAKNIVNRFWQGSKVMNAQRPTYNTDQSYWMDYTRTDQTVHYEDLRGLYSRGARPTETPKKVTPVQAYYVNPMQYDSFRYNQAYRNPSYPKYSVRITRWFDMKFRSEYFVENGAWFPTDQYGGELLAGINYKLMRGVNLPGQRPGQLSYDGGAWVGWKDDADSGSSLVQGDPTLPGDQARSVFGRNQLVVGVGPRLSVTKDMIFHMTLVNSRRELGAAES